MYTVIVFKADRRKKDGERQVHYADYDTDNLSMLEVERFDTPRYCSPSSEAYWSM